MRQGKFSNFDIKYNQQFEAETKLWKLRKTVYGLGDTSRAWHLWVRDEFVTYGARVRKYDEAIFYWHYNNKLEHIVCSHKDEFFWRRLQTKFKKQVISIVHKKFKICHEESAVFTYLGLQIEQLPTETHALQSSYINDRRPITIQKGRNKVTMKATNLGLSRDNLIR